MSFDEGRPGEHGDLGPPPPAFRIGRAERQPPSTGWLRWAIPVAVLLVLFVLASIARRVYTQILWFDSVGYASVYRTVIGTQVWLFVAGAALSSVFFAANMLVTRRFLPSGPWVTGAWNVDIDPALLRLGTTLVLAAIAVIAALSFGAAASSHWETMLQFLHARQFGQTDAFASRDISFYVFRLPAWRFFQGWALGLAILTLICTSVVYFGSLSLRGFGTPASRGATVHISLLVIIVLALYGWGYWLDIAALPNSSAGLVYGATYTDIHARQPVYWLLIALLAVVVLLVAWNMRSRRALVPVVALAVWAAVGLAGRNIYPVLLQRFQVDPNEYTREAPYIARNIAATRAAFGLDRISEEDYPAEPAATEAEVQANAATITNVRLWDSRPLLDTYNQVQAIRPLYLFQDVDVDRYTIDGQYRQVMLSARELSQDRLPENAQGWVNQRLQFTHGYGLAMSPVNEVVQEGLPSFFEQDIPPAGKLAITRPEIYFGEVSSDYVITNSKQQEFDYPSGQSNVYTQFSGGGGVGIGNPFRRFLYAWEFGDFNILISQELTGDSRILYHRNIMDRVQTIAPFLTYDPDPYLVTVGGRLLWIIDAYTTTSNYPYSQPADEGFNYIRNSVKVVIDAYDGSTTFYVVDPADPLLATYRAIYPDLFTPGDQMPADLRAHLRYPEGLLRVQAQQYATYHMTEPQVFYNKEDLWKIPNELFGSQQIEVQPYYTIMKLPGEASEEFVLILPFTPANRDNTVAWMAARSDGDKYGSLLSFRFPKDRLIYGPAQIEARVDQDALISQQLTLWNQAGSSVIRGNLLMIPIGQSVIYVEPIFLQAEQSQLPELKRVVLANGNDIAMEPTLARALDVVFGHAARTLPGQEPGGPAPPTPTPTASPGGTGTPSPSATPSPTASPGGLPDTVKNLAALAKATYDQAQAYLRAGDLESYGREIAQLDAILTKLNQVAAGQ